MNKKWIPLGNAQNLTPCVTFAGSCYVTLQVRVSAKCKGLPESIVAGAPSQAAGNVGEQGAAFGLALKQCLDVRFEL